MPFEDLSLNAVQIMNKYFIIPVESLNMSVLSLQTSVNNFNTAINNFNTSTLANTSSITTLNTSITILNSSVLSIIESGLQTLNQVLTNGNTTTNTANFTDITTGTTLDVIGTGIVYTLPEVSVTSFNNVVKVQDISGSLTTQLKFTGLLITDENTGDWCELGKTRLLIDNVNNNTAIELTNKPGLSPVIRLKENASNVALTPDSLSFKFGVEPTISSIGLSVVSNGISIKTNGTLSLTDLSGSTGQFLKLNSDGNAVWDTIDITSLNNTINEVLTNINTSVNNAIDTVNSTTLTIGGTNGTSSQSYGGALTSGTLNLATAITTGNINIGSSTATNQVNIGGVLVGANAINPETNGTNFQIASTNTSGSIDIGSSQTSGVLNIGTNVLRTVTGEINLGNPANASPLVIAGASVKVAIGGSYGSAGNVLTSGGSVGSVTWSPAGGSSTIINGKILNPVYSATTPQLYTFSSPFTGTIPNVVLTVNNGSSSSATIILAGLASVSLTGFYYVISATPPAGSTLNWFATQ